MKVAILILLQSLAATLQQYFGMFCAVIDFKFIASFRKHLVSILGFIHASYVYIHTFHSFHTGVFYSYIYIMREIILEIIFLKVKFYIVESTCIFELHSNERRQFFQLFRLRPDRTDIIENH